MVERRTIVFSDPRLSDLEHPAFEARGKRDGPHVVLIAGVHGCEYSSIAAVIRVMNQLDTDELAGSITAVPVVSMQSFEHRSPFVVPEDGKNLNPIGLSDLEHPAFEARGKRDGPHVVLIAGVHGCEYSSIAAVIRVMNQLDTDELAGSITAVPVVSMQSFEHRSPFVVPEDGKNLN